MENVDLTKNKQKVELDFVQDESVYVIETCHQQFPNTDELGTHCNVHYEDREVDNKNKEIVEVLTDMSSYNKQCDESLMNKENTTNKLNENIQINENGEVLIEIENEERQEANQLQINGELNSS